MNIIRTIALTISAAAVALTMTATNVNRGYAVRMWSSDTQASVPAIVSFDLNAPSPQSSENYFYVEGV
ncbi:MAG: hypothetical protein ACI30W_00775 [Muribaculaceae bacterium]